MSLFKQMTCDTCFRPLDSIGRHNRYYFCKIVEFERVDKAYYVRNFSKYNDNRLPRFNYDTSNWSMFHNYVYCYLFDSWPTPNGYSTWFCDNKCALKAAIRMNAILFYYDEKERSVAIIPPQINEINNEIGESPFTPLLMQQLPANRWLQQPSDFKDLSEYGYSITFPVFSFSKVNLIQPNKRMIPECRKMFTTPSFAKSYFGSCSPEIIEAIKKMMPDNFDESSRINFGRRTEFAWFISDKKGNFIGFIHLTQNSPDIPGAWWLEFGIIPSQQGKGIMSEVVPNLIKWARQEGCDEPIYAISESFNHACHAILRKIPKTQESIRPMSDAYAGLRNMHVFVMNP